MKKNAATISAEELERHFEAGEDISAFLDWSQARRLGCEPVNVTLPGWIGAALDREAARTGTTREALVHQWLEEKLKAVEKC